MLWGTSLSRLIKSFMQFSSYLYNQVSKIFMLWQITRFVNYKKRSTKYYKCAVDKMVTILEIKNQCIF